MNNRTSWWTVLKERALLLIPTRWWLWSLIFCAKQVFPFAQIWARETGGSPRVVHFALTEGDFNTAVRARVEWLDQRRVGGLK